MFDASYKSQRINAFGGGRSRPDPVDVPPTGALVVKNSEFVDGSAESRHGFNAIPTSHTSYGPYTAMHNWITSGYNNLVTLTSTGALKIFSIPGVTDAQPGSMENPGVGGTFAQVGLSLFCANHLNSASGASFPRVIVNQGGTYTIDNAIPGPSGYVPVASEPGSGVMTAGVHRFGYLIQYRTGFLTRPSPDSGQAGGIQFPVNSFVPISYTASGSKNLGITFTAWNTPPNAISIWIILTTAANPNRYYIVPGSQTAITPGAPNTFTVTVNISDADLSSQATDVTDSLFQLTGQEFEIGTASPFRTAMVLLYGTRMVYVGVAINVTGGVYYAAYISEPNNYEYMTFDQHIVQIPGQQDITCAFSMGGSLYLLTRHATYVTYDNTGVPVSWPTPQLVDGRKGVLAPTCVEVAANGTHAFVADQGGLYVFGVNGYAQLPISFDQTPDWQRINWAAAGVVQVKDCSYQQIVRVMVPLDGATTPTHIMTWDYTNGLTWDTVMYSLDNITNVPFGAMAVVQNDDPAAPVNTQRNLELWIAPYAASKAIYRQLGDFDTNPFVDNGGDIVPWYYQTGLFRNPNNDPQVLQHHGYSLRATGTANLSVTLSGLDGVITSTAADFVLSVTPGKEYQKLFPDTIKNEYVSYTFQFGAAGPANPHARIASLKHYYSPWAMENT